MCKVDVFRQHLLLHGPFPGMGGGSGSGSDRGRVYAQRRIAPRRAGRSGR